MNMMPQTPATIQFVADRGDAGRRIDLALVRHVRAVSRMTRTQAQAWIAAGSVSVDGAVVQRAAARLREGASIEVALPDTARPRTAVEGESLALEILFEDASMLVINKPAGVVVHPSYKNSSGTLLNAVLGHLGRNRPPQADPVVAEVVTGTPGIVTRLDKDTSGLVLVALTPAVHRTLQQDASRGDLRKSYLAVVRGAPRPRGGVIRLPLARDVSDRRRVTVQPTGAASETSYETVVAAEGWALLRCELVTGRTHQIRVHLSARGWPIAGDRQYGTPHAALTRQALHAWRVEMLHPLTRTPMTIGAPLPADISEAFPLLRAPPLLR